MFLAPWYRLLWPAPPAVVRDMTPSEVASVLGWDQRSASGPLDGATLATPEERPAPVPQHRNPDAPRGVSPRFHRLPRSRGPRG